MAAAPPEGYASELCIDPESHLYSNWGGVGRGQWLWEPFHGGIFKLRVSSSFVLSHFLKSTD